MAKQVDISAAPYMESEDHVPDPMNVFGTLDTSGTAGGNHERPEHMTPVFEAATAQDLAYAARAVDPEDTEVPESNNVILPVYGMTAEEGREHIRQAARAFEQKPVKVQDPSLTESADDAAAAEDMTDDEQASRAESQQRGTSPLG